MTERIVNATRQWRPGYVYRDISENYEWMITSPGSKPGTVMLYVRTPNRHWKLSNTHYEPKPHMNTSWSEREASDEEKAEAVKLLIKEMTSD